MAGKVGRPRNAEKFEAAIASFTELAALGLGQNFDNLCTLADGGFERVENKYEPAGTITRKELARDGDGNIVRDDKGKPTVVETPLYPDLDPDSLVLVERKVIRMAPDFKANEYLCDRAMGRPRQALELNNGDGGPLQIQVVYADAIDDDIDPAEAPPGAAESPPGDATV